MQVDLSIITIGDELLIGQVVDTNSAWMGQQLVPRGFAVKQKYTVSDSAESIRYALDESLRRSDVVLITGGIGPTKDDVTKKTLADYFGMEVVHNDYVEAYLIDLLGKRGRTLNELTRTQAEVPVGATLVLNRIGTAPVLWFEQHGKIIVSMPGVPIEMKLVMEEGILPRLERRFPHRSRIESATYYVYGYSESGLAEYIAPWEESLPEMFGLAYLPSFSYVRLRVTGRSDSPYLRSWVDYAGVQLKAILGSKLIDTAGLDLPLFVGQLLRSRGEHISTVESCTGGLIAHRLTAEAGASDFYEGSIIAYSNRIKRMLLRISPTVLTTEGAVSRTCVEGMLDDGLKRFRTEACIAVSGIAGPGGGAPDKPVGTVWVGVHYRGKREVKCFHFGQNREQNINRTVETALLELTGLMIE